jgi:hypothetical protein
MAGAAKLDARAAPVPAVRAMNVRREILVDVRICSSLCDRVVMRRHSVAAVNLVTFWADCDLL